MPKKYTKEQKKIISERIKQYSEAGLNNAQIGEKLEKDGIMTANGLSFARDNAVSIFKTAWMRGGETNAEV